jgi:hypothetical protein
VAFGILVLLLLLALPTSRQALEASMTIHMLVQYPLLAGAGFVLANTLSPAWVDRLNAWNAYGLSGLFATALILAILMIPRVLDLALVNGQVETAKWLALIFCGAAIRFSWVPAGLLVQGFFLGNVLPMMAVVGNLYESSPVRVCNAYLLEDQAQLGQWLLWITTAIGVLWFYGLVLTLIRREKAVSLLHTPDSRE